MLSAVPLLATYSSWVIHFVFVFIDVEIDIEPADDVEELEENYETEPTDVQDTSTGNYYSC